MYVALILVTALGLGMRHATDADHVLAISTMISRQRSLSRALEIGVLWGAGHMATILLVGGAIVVFDVIIPQRVTGLFEGCVAVMLMLLGVRSFMAAGHRDGDGKVAPPFAVGVVHGVAGSAAAALLIVPLIPSPLWAALYLVIFGLGTIVGMMVLTYAIAGSTLYATRRVHSLDGWLRMGAGAASIAFGALLLSRL